MTCNCNSKNACGCEFNIRTVGVCDVSKLNLNGQDRTQLNWTEISIPEILYIPEVKPEIENIDQVYASIMVDCVKLIETPFAYKSYPLCYLSADVLAAIRAVTGTITADIGDIGTSLTVLTDILGAVAGVLGLPEDLATLVTDLATNLDDALTAVTDAADSLVAIVSLANPLASLVCEALGVLINALNALLVLVDSVIPTINQILNSVSALLQGLITAAIDGVLGLLGLTLESTVQAVVDAIAVILDPLVVIDCNPGTAFELIGNAEGTCLTGRKLIIEGTLKQKVVYTAELSEQSVHSAHFEVPFIAFIIPYASFEGLTAPRKLKVYDEKMRNCKEITGFVYNEATNIVPNLEEQFDVKACIEDIYVKALGPKKVFKNVTAFFSATPVPVVVCN